MYQIKYFFIISVVFFLLGSPGKRGVFCNHPYGGIYNTAHARYPCGLSSNHRMNS